MKGDRQRPAVRLLGAPSCRSSTRLIPEYQTVDVLADPEIRDGIKEYSSWPTIPQLYIDGEFQGGCDIVREMYAERRAARRSWPRAPRVAERTRLRSDAGRFSRGAGVR